jgi:hypothetical protein
MTANKVTRVRIVADSDYESPCDGENLGTMVCSHRRYTLGDEQCDGRPPVCDWIDWQLVSEAEAAEAIKRIAKSGADGAASIRRFWDSSAVGRKVDFLANNLAELMEWTTTAADVASELAALHNVILPLYLYDHSGITMSCGPFSCPWDSGQVGIIKCSLADAQANWMITDDADKAQGWDYTMPDWMDGETYIGDRPAVERPTITLRAATERNLRAEVKVYDQFLTGDVYGFIVEDYDAVTDEWKQTDSCWGFYGSDPTTNGMDDHLGPELTALAKSATIEYPNY